MKIFKEQTNCRLLRRGSGEAHHDSVLLYCSILCCAVDAVSLVLCQSVVFSLVCFSCTEKNLHVATGLIGRVCRVSCLGGTAVPAGTVPNQCQLDGNALHSAQSQTVSSPALMPETEIWETTFAGLEPR